MASITHITLGAGSGVMAPIAKAFGRIAAWNDARVTRAALSKLSDHELDDLGLIRGDIDTIAEAQFRR